MKHMSTSMARDMWRTSAMRQEQIQVDGEGVTIEFEQAPTLRRYPLVHGVTCRTGGVSEGPFGTFNMGLHVQDQIEAVHENRRRLARMLGLEADRLTCGEQVHGVGVTRITEDLVGRGAFDWQDGIPQSDAIHTNLVQVPLLLLVADCVPVLVYDREHHAVAVVHAGWRGAIAHILEDTLTSMHEHYGTRPLDCELYIGPSIGGNSFEVSESIADTFRQDMHRLQLPGIDTVVRYLVRPGQTTATPHVDLKRYLAISMESYGIASNQIVVSPTDTMTSSQCFSYRRDGGITGRMALFAMLREP